MNTKMSLQEMMDKYLWFREVSGLKKSTIFQLIQFNRDCKKNYPEKDGLTQEMVDLWCTKRDSELPSSQYSRTHPIISFLKFALQRKWADLSIPKISSIRVTPPVPHAFTDKELENFFKACDEIKGGAPIQVKLRKLQVPIFFRLLYSSGMRPIEARLLRTEDVNLTTGVINIRQTKGYNEHRIVLDDTMRKMLNQYDKEISTLISCRKVFFPNYSDKPHWNIWVCDQFREFWYKYNSAKAVPYGLRHNYAIQNINSWTSQGFEVHDKLVALSKSMGHSIIKSTMYYYSLVPKLATIIESLSGETYNEIIPNLPEDDED